MIPVYGGPWCLTLDPSGWGWSLCRRLLLAPCSRRRILSWLSSLGLRVFGSYCISPLCFPDCRYAFKATCAALPPASRLSFVLRNISFWLGFGRCLIFLFAPCGCRRAYCGPHCGSESARVLASLFGTSPSGVQPPFSCLFLSLRPCRSRSPIPSLAPSWWSPCPLMRWALLTLSGYVLCVPSAFSLRRSSLSIPFAMSPLSRSISADGICLFMGGSSCGGASPHVLGSVGALGVSAGSTYIALHRTWSVNAICRTPIGAQVGVSYFSCATFRKYSWRSFCQFHWLMCVPASTSPLGCVPWTLIVSSDWVDLLSPSSHFQDSVDCADL